MVLLCGVVLYLVPVPGGYGISVCPSVRPSPLAWPGGRAGDSDAMLCHAMPCRAMLP